MPRVSRGLRAHGSGRLPATRADSDFGTNVLEEVSATGLYDVNDCVEVEHDSETHQLRALGRVPFDTARAADARGHYETLIRARI